VAPPRVLLGATQTASLPHGFKLSATGGVAAASSSGTTGKRRKGSRHGSKVSRGGSRTASARSPPSSSLAADSVAAAAAAASEGSGASGGPVSRRSSRHSASAAASGDDGSATSSDTDSDADSSSSTDSYSSSDSSSSSDYSSSSSSSSSPSSSLSASPRSSPHTATQTTVPLSRRTLALVARATAAARANHLGALQLQNCCLTRLPDTLLAGLRAATGLRAVDLSRNLLGDVEVVRLSQVLRNCKSLSIVSLWFNQVGNLGATTLVHSLLNAHDPPAIRTLSLGCNPITDKGVLAICELLVDHKVPLTSLDLSFCDMTSESAPGIASLLRDDSASLRSLALVNTALGDAGVLRLASVLVGNGSLEHLDLSGTGITKVGIGGLAMAIGAGCTKLKSLSMERNRIDAEGAANFATTALQASSSLHVLSLAYNAIGNEGAGAIARAVGARNVVESLNLGKNKIHAEGAQAIATNLQACTSLYDLSLFGNRVGADGARAIGALIARPNSKLQFVSLFTCNLGDSGAIALAEMLENVSLPVLVDLDLRFNRIAEDGALALASALEGNTDNLNLMQAANGGKLHVGYNPIPDETRARIGRALGQAESPGFTRREKKPRLGPTRMALTRHSIRFDVTPIAARRSRSPSTSAAPRSIPVVTTTRTASSPAAAPTGLGRISRFFVGPLSRLNADEPEFEAGDGAATPRPSGEDSDGGPMARSRTLGSAAWRGIKGRSDSMSGSLIRRRPRQPRKPDSAPRSTSSTPRAQSDVAADSDTSPRSAGVGRSRIRSLLSGAGGTPDSSMRRESK